MPVNYNIFTASKAKIVQGTVLIIVSAFIYGHDSETEIDRPVVPGGGGV